MTNGEFRLEVISKVPQGLSPEAVESAIRFYGKEKECEQRNVSDCVVLAGTIDECYRPAGGRENGEVETPLFPMSAGLLLASQQVQEKMTQGVEQVRISLFGRLKPPFRSYWKAVKWLEAQGEQPGYSADVPQEAIALMRHLIDGARKLAALLEGEVKPFRLVRRTIPYGKPKQEWLHQLPVVPGTPLAKLEDNSRKMAEATGFSHANVVAHILAGMPLCLPAARLKVAPRASSLQSGVPVGRLGRSAAGYKLQINSVHRRVSFNIEIPNPGSITAKRFGALFHEMRKMLGLRKTKQLSDKDHYLLKLVKQLGGPPRKKKTVFWQRVQHDWNEQSQERGWAHHKTWEACRVAHHRLLKKVKVARTPYTHSNVKGK